MNSHRDMLAKPARRGDPRSRQENPQAYLLEHKARQLRLAELRKQEEQLAGVKPTPESYIKLADDYHALGLTKESDRLHHMAELVESGGQPLPSQPNPGLLSGTANPTMIAEMVQILSRTTLTGELLIDGQVEMFHVFFDHGQIINASSQSHTEGIVSFFMALRVACGTYQFCEKPVKTIKRLIQGSTDMLLLNAMHAADEEKSCKPAL
jgi:hypothetical protein